MGDVHIVWELCTLYGKRAHCMGNMHIVWEVCTLCEKRANFWKTCSLYKSDNNHFPVVTMTFVGTQYPLYRPYKSRVSTKEVILMPLVNAKYE